MTQTRDDIQRPHPRIARGAALMLLIGLAGTLLAACDTTARSANPTATPRAMFTPTATTVPRVLYQADWSHGANGWHLPAHWQVSGGALLNDGTGTTSTLVPFDVTAPQYTLTFQAQVQAVTPAKGPSGGEYGVIAEDTHGHPLYYAILSGLDAAPPHHGYSYIFAPNSTIASTQDFVPGSILRTFVVRVRGDEISFIIDGSGLGSVTSPVPLVPSRLELIDQYVQLTITSVTLTTP